MTAAHSIAGRLGSLKSWANTVDRTARTRNGRAASPSSIDWHLARLDPEKFANASDEQRFAAAEAAHRAYFVELGMKSARSRRRAS